MYELNKICDAKVVQTKPEGQYIPPKAANLVVEEADIDEETHLCGRAYVYNEALAPFQNIAKTLSAILVLEGDKLPDSWVAVSNVLDFVWTASSYGYRQFINNRIIPDKVKVIPHGIDPRIFYPNPHITERPDAFVFGFVGGFAVPNDRKGADILAKAFSEEFDPSEKVRLMMKINKTYNPLFDSIGYLRYISNNHSGIIYDDQFFTQEQLAWFYNLTDVHVMPTMGEAFSMNLAESMACGRTMITTNYSGHLDYCLPEFSYLVDVEKFRSAHYGQWDIECGTKWALPSTKHLKEQMRYVYDNQDECRKKGMQAMRHIHDNYKWSDAAKKMYEVLKNA